MKQKIPLILLISLLLLFFFSIGCSSSLSRRTHRKSNIVEVTVDDQNVSVEIREKFDEKGDVIKRGFYHPYFFTEARLVDILSSVYYKESGYITGRKEKMVFREDELRNIIPPIIHAFSMAGESQDILVFSSPHDDIMANTRTYFSMFVTSDGLNIVFSEINSIKNLFNDGRAIQMNTYSRDSNKSTFRDPLEVKRGSRWRLAPIEGQRFLPGRPNWLIIDLSSNLFGMYGSKNSNDISINVGNSAGSLEEKKRTKENNREENREKQRRRDELIKLKTLNDQGSISDEDYKKRKKEILGNFIIE